MKNRTKQVSYTSYAYVPNQFPNVASKSQYTTNQPFKMHFGVISLQCLSPVQYICYNRKCQGIHMQWAPHLQLIHLILLGLFCHNHAMAVQDKNDSLHSSKDISSSSKKTTKIIPPKPHNRKVQNCHKVRQHTRAHHCLKLHEHFKTQIYICLYIFLSNIIAFSTKGRVYTKELSH